MLQACGLDASHMPALAVACPTGTLLGDVARRWGLREGVVVAAGAGDNAASAVGVGAHRRGQGFVSLGTSGVVFRVTDAFAPPPNAPCTLFAHARRIVGTTCPSCSGAASGWVGHPPDWPRRRRGPAVCRRGRLCPPAARPWAPLFCRTLVVSAPRTTTRRLPASSWFCGPSTTPPTSPMP